jgi:hypothetical protein
VTVRRSESLAGGINEAKLRAALMVRERRRVRRDTTVSVLTTEALARVDVLPAQAARRGLTIWTADDGFVAALLGAAAIRDPVRAAALLARLPPHLAPARVPPAAGRPSRRAKAGATLLTDDAYAVHVR